MDYGHVPGVDKPISRLVQGTVMVREDDLPYSFALLDAALAAGITAFDTARHYGNGNEAARLGQGRQETGPHRLHQEEAPLAGEQDQLASLRGVERKGLLAQHAFARFQAEPGIGVVARVRRGDVDDIDVGIMREINVARVMPASAKPLREVSGRLGRTGANRGQLGVRQHLQGRGEGRRDAPGTQDPPADRFQRILPFRSNDAARSLPAWRIPVSSLANLEIVCWPLPAAVV